MEMTDAGMGKQAEQLRMYAEGLGGAAGDAARAWATGIPATKEAAAASLLMDGAIQENIEAINNNKQATQAISDTMVKGAQGAKTFGANMAYMGDIAGGAAGQMMDYREIVEQATKEGKTVEQVAAERQKKQADASGALTKDFTAAQMAVANSSKNIQKLGFTLAIQAVPAVETFAKGLNDLTDFINDHFGNIAGSKKENAQNEENWNNMKVGSKALHGIAVGLEETADFIGLSKLANNARKSRMESETTEFGTNKVVGSDPGAKGNEAKLTGVNAQLADAVEKATAEYKKITGKTATITSGVRDREKQERMYNEWVAGGRKGKPVAPPGKSKHETGNAVDISEADANAMDRLGLLKRYGLDRPVAGDPVHVQLAGPVDNYKPQVAQESPTKTLPVANASSSAANLPTPGDSAHLDALIQINSQLARLNSSNEAIAGHTKKSVQLQS